MTGKIFFVCVGVLNLFSIFAAHAHPAPGDKPEFEFAKIPLPLALNASAVVRLDETVFTVENPGKAIERGRRAVTILNANGREFGKMVLWYDRFRELKNLNGMILDAQGKKIRDLKKDDVKDYSAITSFSLYDDNRVRVVEFYHDAYPYTVVFDYELNHNGLINWPAWYPQEEVEPVERATFELQVPANMPVRYRLRRIDTRPQIDSTATRKILRWEATLLPKRELEAYGPPRSEQMPCVLTAPAVFEIAGYRGDMSSWEAFGKWYQELLAGRTTLPPPALSEVQSLCVNAASPREKVRLLYEHLQAKTRYVSVQLGVGAWQPFDPAYVYQRGYGDCKALSNYMIAILRAVGIESYPVLIHRGTRAPEVIADFPSNQFNHVIVAVPMEKDTLWLECTSQTAPFAYLGSDDEDRNVLLVTPNGGKLVRTPRSRAADNQQIRRALVTINATGDGVAEVWTRYTGNQQDYVRETLATKTPQERDDWLREEIDVPAFQIVSADFSEVDGKRAEIKLPIKLALPRFASRSGTRLFLRPNLMERWKRVPPELKERRHPVTLSYTFLDTDTISYRLPNGFVIEAAPAPVAVETAFGSYQSATMPRDGALEFTRRLEMRASRLPATQYEAYRQFIADVVKADHAQIVLVRQPN